MNRKIVEYNPTSEFPIEISLWEDSTDAISIDLAMQLRNELNDILKHFGK